MKLLVVGSKGQVGHETVNLAGQRDWEVVATDLPELDIADHGDVKRFIPDVAPEVVINAAAYTAVDRAEEEPELSFAVNADGPAHLADVCAHLAVPLIHISTDYVFDGQGSTPYSESDVPRPLGVYGESKLAGEERVRDAHRDHVILRTSWVFSDRGSNFVKTMLRLAREREVVRVVDDQRGRPTAASDIARALLDIAAAMQESSDLRGTFHFAGDEPVTWFEFAKAIIREAAKHQELAVVDVVPISTREYPTPVERPAYSVLDCSKIENVIGIRTPPWRRALAEVVESLCSIPAEWNPKAPT